MKSIVLFWKKCVLTIRCFFYAGLSVHCGLNESSYFQMEFCEKSTLRNCIDAGLYEDVDRVWQLFREVVEGLVHIHKQVILDKVQGIVMWECVYYILTFNLIIISTEDLWLTCRVINLSNSLDRLVNISPVPKIVHIILLLLILLVCRFILM